MFSGRSKNKTDEELIDLIQQGDQRALTLLYDRYGKKLIRYFHRMLWKDEAKAQDFLHDLFIKIIEKNQMIAIERRFSTWIYSVAFNMCKNEYRKQSFRTNAISTKLSDTEVYQPEPDYANFSAGLDTLMKNADESERNLFVLRYELDMPIAEIALVLECPEGTVKSRLFYLKKKIAMQLHVYNPLFN